MSDTLVFIVRPFATQKGIDFDRVEKELIRPALIQAEFWGGTTATFIQQGNIRKDMFEQLLIADIVVADISIHNANVFYELGIRHALRDRHTFLIKSKGDEVPFDLKTDRYMDYDADNPAAKLPELVNALKKTRDLQKSDSPVFELLPDLEPVDRIKFLILPLNFREEVERAKFAKKCGDLQLMSAELDGLAWKASGLRLIGDAQFELNDMKGAKATWEAVRKHNDMDLEANTILGTVYQRLGDLVKSNQALARAIQNNDASSWDRAEIRALMARNEKTLWQQDWNEIEDLDAVQKAALASPHLKRSYALYRKGFTEDRNHFYSGLNALAMVTIITKLAAAHSEIWEEDFDSRDEAALQLRKLEKQRSVLTAGVKLAIESKLTVLARQDKTDIRTEISAADLIFLSSNKPNRVGRAYQKALTKAPDYARDSTSNQIRLYPSLGIFMENTQAALDNTPLVEHKEKKPEAAPRVILFTGHRIDAEGRETPRFPPDRENQARAMILEAVSMEKKKIKGKLLGISGGASGGDILFHEVCEELDIPTNMYLVLPKNNYIKASVADGGPNWVERFKRLIDLNQPEILSDSGELPRWLRSKSDYSIWQRSNLWMLHNALYISNDNLTLIALWNGEVGDGPGGTEDMVRRAKDRGATFIHIDACKLISGEK